MASIIPKNDRRYRVQFTMSHGLFAAYEIQKGRAKKLRLVLDFGCDFETWFEGQLDHIRQELDKIEAEQSSAEQHDHRDQCKV